MIHNFREITSEYPIRQIWKFLRLFLDVPSVSETIRQIHKIPKGNKYDSNVKKQARQIGYCIRQAEEYFQASSEVDLATRPTLLYYGAVSLSRALVLLRQSGDYSFDALRKSKKHNHHGLDLIRGLVANIKAGAGPAVFFESLQCDVHTKKWFEDRETKPKSSPEDSSISEADEAEADVRVIPWGHFPLFYKSLVPCAFRIPMKVHTHGAPTSLESNFPHACANLLSLDSLQSMRLNALSLLKTMPDMYSEMKGIGILPDLCRGSMKRTIVNHYKTNEQGEKELFKVVSEEDFLVDAIHQAQKEKLLSFYQEKNPDIKLQADLGANIHLVWKQQILLTNEHREEKVYHYPDIVEDINGRKFYIIDPETYVPEPAAHLVILYCLGMLSRYYPDIWMNVIDGSVQTAELTSSLLEVINRKFPNLILDQMTWTKHYVHL